MFAALLYAPWEDNPDRLCGKPVRPRSEPLDHFHPDNVFLGADDVRRFEAIKKFVAIEPQLEVHGFRVDFAVAGRCGWFGQRVRGLFVECDGAEWHTSPVQRQRDSERQQKIQSCTGLLVMRFTGSEIFRDPNACAARVVEYVRGFVPQQQQQAVGADD